MRILTHPCKMRTYFLWRDKTNVFLARILDIFNCWFNSNLHLANPVRIISMVRIHWILMLAIAQNYFQLHSFCLYIEIPLPYLSDAIRTISVLIHFKFDMLIFECRPLGGALCAIHLCTITTTTIINYIYKYYKNTHKLQ